MFAYIAQLHNLPSLGILPISFLSSLVQKGSEVTSEAPYLFPPGTHYAVYFEKEMPRRWFSFL